MYLIGTGFLIPMFYKDPPPILSTSFLKNFVHTPPVPNLQSLKDKARKRDNTLTHPYGYILTPPVMCSQQVSVLY